MDDFGGWGTILGFNSALVWTLHYVWLRTTFEFQVTFLKNVCLIILLTFFILKFFVNSTRPSKVLVFVQVYGVFLMRDELKWILMLLLGGLLVLWLVGTFSRVDMESIFVFFHFFQAIWMFCMQRSLVLFLLLNMLSYLVLENFD